MASHRIGRAIEAGIQGWVKALGKPFPGEGLDWLAGPVGVSGTIGPEIAYDVARTQNLAVRAGADFGLIPHFRALRGEHFDPDRIDPRVRHFYEKTGRYRLAVDAEWSPLFLPPGWALISFVSQRIEQLNVPLSPVNARSGITNEIVQLVDPRSGELVCTGWLRRVRSTGAVMYAGFYSVVQPPNGFGPCVKVVFPLPRGSATVLLKPQVHADGSFLLVSEGRRWGDAGFYRILDAGGGTRKVRYVRAFRETFHVYVDGAGELLTDHVFRFFWPPVVRLRYRMSL